MSSEILVFGASGFIGRHVCRHFHSEFARRRSTSLSGKDVDLRDKRQINDYAKKHSAVVVVFLAGKSPYHGAERDIFTENIVMLENVVQAFGKKLEHIIYASTTDVYGKSASIPIMEQKTPDPQSWYAKSKFEAETFLRQLPRYVKVTIFRMASVYGEFDDGKRAIVGYLKNAILNGEQIEIVGAGRQIRDLTYADDIARVMGIALSLGIVGTYNLVSGHQYSIDRIVDILAKAADVTPAKVFGAQGEERDVIFDNSQLLKAFGKSNFVRLEDVVGRLISPSRKSIPDL